MPKSIGISIGASTVKLVRIDSDTMPVVTNTESIPHESKPREVIADLMARLRGEHFDYGMVTGRDFRNILSLPSIPEPYALEQALDLLRLQGSIPPSCAALASLGAENFIVYLLDSAQTIVGVETGNKCASGTGEFFLQQLRRMNLDLDTAMRLETGGDTYRVSGRCSVFCKSDCTHALNKGIPVDRVTRGLCSMMTEKVLELLEKIPAGTVVLAGGVTNNHVIVDLLSQKREGIVVAPHAPVMEALGSAWYALKNKVPWSIPKRELFNNKHSVFGKLPPISGSASRVRFETHDRGTARTGDRCIIGLDVGSTTTKAVVMRKNDCAVLASVYLRTNGNPVDAARHCYRALETELAGVDVEIVGLATTGSGRQIAGIHADASAVINEIIAHSAGAAFYDPAVDTIYEIGGQDAKYTHLTNGVPSDYAMNEACSAGTGSFLEEASRESLAMAVTDIGETALRGSAPPNFSDQCAAFISSDIKSAIHEGISTENIAAGLVYSICQNYINRVKGQRPTGTRIFMQGGVCYNRAVPLAMAHFANCDIVVPPDPGLIGAFGVACELKQRLQNGQVAAGHFELARLSQRELAFGKRFACQGGAEHCDRRCEISMITVDGKQYPFGGACNKYYNQVHHLKSKSDEFDYVDRRHNLVFSGDHALTVPGNGPTIGITRSFLTNTLYPLYARFFTALGCRIVLPEAVDDKGIKQKQTSLCYPAEIAHGYFHNLLERKPDFLFLPKIVEYYVENSVSRRREHQCTCLLLQSEPYLLKSAFKTMLGDRPILDPVLDFSQGWQTQQQEFVALARSVGRSARKGRLAYASAVESLRTTFDAFSDLGSRFLNQVEGHQSGVGLVLFGRPYNAFAPQANMQIPRKFTTRGIPIVPWDALPWPERPCDSEMNWALGQGILKAADFVAAHPRLFGVYITNFSCGPDSFLISYFRRIMHDKPSLTLELDSHSADAGINTRIEAFIDIVEKFRHNNAPRQARAVFVPATISFDHSKPWFHRDGHESIPLKHQDVHFLFPSMGDLASRLIAAVSAGFGFRSSAIPPYDTEVLKLGRAVSTGKECLPLQLVAGGLRSWLEKNAKPEDRIAYFMPTCGGNCRFTQYSVFLRNMIEDLKLPNVALVSLTNENGYAGFSFSHLYTTIKSFIISDVLDDIKNTLAVVALDRESAMATFNTGFDRLCSHVNRHRSRRLYAELENLAGTLADIPLKYPVAQAKTVSLLGEIFVRRDWFSSQGLIDKLAERDIVVRRAHIYEWIDYSDYNVQNGIYESRFNPAEKTQFMAKRYLLSRVEKKIKKIFARSGLYTCEMVDMDKLIGIGKHFYDVRFTGESILVAGAYFRDILHSIHGAISIGPFACMPTRVNEGVLSVEANRETLNCVAGRSTTIQDAIPHRLPFLSVEADGNPFSQLIEARLDAFCLQVERVHGILEGNSKCKRTAPVT